jgi:hypothetical protein
MMIRLMQGELLVGLGDGEGFGVGDGEPPPCGVVLPDGVGLGNGLGDGLAVVAALVGVGVGRPVAVPDERAETGTGPELCLE